MIRNAVCLRKVKTNWLTSTQQEIQWYTFCWWSLFRCVQWHTFCWCSLFRCIRWHAFCWCSLFRCIQWHAFCWSVCSDAYFSSISLFSSRTNVECHTKQWDIYIWNVTDSHQKKKKPLFIELLSWTCSPDLQSRFSRTDVLKLSVLPSSSKPMILQVKWTFIIRFNHWFS